MDRDLVEMLFASTAMLCLAAYAAWMVVSAVLEEAANPLRKWVNAKRCRIDRRQPVSVRRCVERLASDNRNERLLCADLLGRFNDRTAVPALMLAAERAKDDMPMLLVIAWSLAQLGDPRSLPTLRRMMTGHSFEIMKLAREAVEAIEPQHTLLRASEAPAVEPRVLLRAVVVTPDPLPHQLLRSAGEEV